MNNSIQSVALDRLIAHPDNSNRMSGTIFAKLARNIERSGRYEPIVARPHPQRPGCFEIINGHHRCKALAKLGYQAADVIVWDVDDEQTNILLVTLNRLTGSDDLGKKLALLRRLNKKMEFDQLAKLLPQTKKQLQQLANLKRPDKPAVTETNPLATALVFFVNDTQKQIVDNAMAMAQTEEKKLTKAEKNTAALIKIAQHFLNQ